MRRYFEEKYAEIMQDFNNIKTIFLFEIYINIIYKRTCIVK